MARIRSIKPEFWTDEKLGRMAPLDRLVFLGLISQADDAGRLIDSVKMLDGLLFPYTDDTCGPSLDALARLGRIQRYRDLSGRRLLEVCGWAEHQKVKNPSTFVLPAPTEVIGTLPDIEFAGDSTENRSRLSVDSTPRVRAGAAPTQGIGDPTTHTGGGESDPLAVWLGELAPSVAQLPFEVDRTVLVRQFGPNAMRADAWKLDDGGSVPEADRPRLFAAALSGYGAEGNKRFVLNQFVGMLKATVRSAIAPPRAPTAKALAQEKAEYEAGTTPEVVKNLAAAKALGDKRLADVQLEASREANATSQAVTWLATQPAETRARADLLLRKRLAEKHGFHGDLGQCPKIFLHHATREVVEELRAVAAA